VTLSMSDGRAEGYKAPDFRGFRVLGEYPGQSTNIQMGGGGTVMRTVYTCATSCPPSESGRLTINPARVRVRGKELSTAPVVITVAAGDISPPGSAGTADPARTASARSAGCPARAHPSTTCSGARPIRSSRCRSPRRAPNKAAGAAISCRWWPDKRRAVVGEQVVVSWYLYWAMTSAITGRWSSPAWTASGSKICPCLSDGGNAVIQEQMHEGRLYKVALLMRKALFPLQTGRCT
jgi:hypothetical protein